MKSYDLIVIGSGPGGYVAAVRAAHLGLKVALVERDKRLGGTCLLRGCIPTKSLLHSADVLEEARHAQDSGIIVSDVRIDFSGVQKARERAVSKGAAGVEYLMKSNKVEVLRGHGSLVDAHTVAIKGAEGSDQVRTKFVLLATGSAPRILASLKPDGKHILSSDQVLELKKMPESMMVLGAGAVGVEFASAYARFGAKMTVVEMQTTFLPNEDVEVGREFERLFKKQGITCHTSTKLEKAEVQDGRVQISLAQGEKRWTESVEVLLVAVGRVPVTDSLGLETVGIELDRGGYIPIDGLMRTRVPHIYAIGDVVPTPWLAHVASAEAVLAVDHMAGREPQPLNYLQTPSCTYSEPEVGSVGLSEVAAKARGYNVKVGKFPFSAVGKARVMGRTDGFVKMVTDARYGEILGVHIIGPRATDLIAVGCVAMRLESTAEDLAHTITAHPTLAEGLLEAAHAAVDRPLHM